MCQVNNFLWHLKEPLVCYKVLRRSRMNHDYYYSSLYWYHTWIKGFTNDTNYDIKYIEYTNGKVDEDYYFSRIEGGFYHAFTKLEDAENELIGIKPKFITINEYVIAKMIIPVTDNICFVGKYGATQTVAAKKMIFDSVIETQRDIQNKINKVHKQEKQSS